MPTVDEINLKLEEAATQDRKWRNQPRKPRKPRNPIHAANRELQTLGKRQGEPTTEEIQQAK